eukprot:1433245-Amphidinium_carterae.1
MENLTRHLHFFIQKQIEEDPLWQSVTVILSGPDVPGEVHVAACAQGEHKIIDYIRFEKAQPDYDPNLRRMTPVTRKKSARFGFQSCNGSPGPGPGLEYNSFSRRHLMGRNMEQCCQGTAFSSIDAPSSHPCCSNVIERCFISDVLCCFTGGNMAYTSGQKQNRGGVRQGQQLVTRQTSALQNGQFPAAAHFYATGVPGDGVLGECVTILHL